ncbi:MAG TPA: hypothetical protein VNS49_19025 [Streptomyces sp.]|nr:hypothetical protein [Streptomyces sp.]
MPGDEVHEEAGTSAQQAADAGRERIGPRHAAPRKPLLNRLHVPAGKAIAMAAMPSAVLMGMGITPQLASAKPLPKSPFKGGSCVSQPDKEETQDKEDKEQAAKIKAAKEKAEAKKKAEAEKERESSDGDGSGSSKPEPSPSESSSSGGSGGGSAEPEPSPSESEEEDDGGLLGGVGDAIGDILTPKEKAEKEKEEEAEEKAEAAPSPSASDSGSGSSESGTKPADDALGKVGDGLKDTTDKLGKTADGAKEALPGKKSESQKAAKGGEKDFPCVEEKKVAGDDEQTPATLPNDPWTLKASSLGLHGLDYEGVVNIRTADGKTKQALKFTADSVDIGDLHQIVDGPNGTQYHVRAAEGSTSTVKGGKVTMYTEELKGNLFGLIPIVFDPEHPPPLNIPEAYFTNVEVTQAGQFGGNLTVPGLRNTIE